VNGCGGQLDSRRAFLHIAKVSMVIGTQVTNPGICTIPVRTYWYADQSE
jgi:hypothetical protein